MLYCRWVTQACRMLLCLAKRSFNVGLDDREIKLLVSCRQTLFNLSLAIDAIHFPLRRQTRVTRCVCEKVTQSVAQTISCVKIKHNFYRRKKWPNCLYYTYVCICIFHKKLPKVNRYPIGENSTNLVTLRQTTYLSPI
jgi:hypothetical protein